MSSDRPNWLCRVLNRMAFSLSGFPPSAYEHLAPKWLQDEWLAKEIASAKAIEEYKARRKEAFREAGLVDSNAEWVSVPEYVAAMKKAA